MKTKGEGVQLVRASPCSGISPASWSTVGFTSEPFLLSSPSAVLAFSQPLFFQALDLFCFSFLWPVRTRTQHSHTRMHTHPHPPFCSPPNVCRIYRLWYLETQSLSPLLSSLLLLLPAKACCCLIPSRKPPLSWGQVLGH